MKLLLGATVFLSSFLLFLVQPVVAKQLLPRFGGSAGVWVVCMVFFQSLLLLGYFYAHGLVTRIPAKSQRNLHVVVIAIAILTLPILVGPQWKATGGASPTFAVLAALTVTVGMPYFLLATTSPLIQAWWARSIPDSNPYRLFALSNVAAIAGLLAYPFAIEPFLPVTLQVSVWTGLFALYCALTCAALLMVHKYPPIALPEHAVPDAAAADNAGTVKRNWPLWLALPALASVALLAVTNHLTQNLSSGPLLWIVPLAIYLVTFVLCFDGKGWYRRRFFMLLVGVTLVAWVWTQADRDLHYLLPWQLAVHLVALFAVCMYCHGELAALKPDPAHLTGYYLAISFGGAIGALLVGIVAPVVFPAFLELQLALCATALLILLREWKAEGWPARALIGAVLLATAAASLWSYRSYVENTLHASRNFYGTLRVKEYGPPEISSRRRSLLHGSILHGDQYVDPPYDRSATSYYRLTSGVGQLLVERKRSAQGPLKVGIVGLGAGTLAVYGNRGDLYRFYEIDKAVVDLATRYFSFIRNSQATVQVTFGDARLVLEGESNQAYDVIVVDAFSSDAIPMHLITREAVRTYQRHLGNNGVIAFHVSNRFLDLKPALADLARELSTNAYWFNEANDDGSVVSDWVLFSSGNDPFGRTALQPGQAEKQPAFSKLESDPHRKVWTDDYHDLLAAMR
ncbi:MAG TPA: fused MFS/spermidine synthase [Usitatibacteraceae bacterium]|nr:fused MFS/spermidine synthase [Usitatibacteraceae bacterium]